MLGPGEVVTVLHKEGPPTPENGEVVWAPSEIRALSVLEGAPDSVRDLWIQYMDAVKRMYPGAKLVSLEPLRVVHSELTQELLERIPWQMLPRR